MGKPALVKDLGMAEGTGRRHRMGVFECPFCQTHFETRFNSVQQGLTQSCGCWNRESSRRLKYKHGGARTRLHQCWRSMKHRCNLKPSHPLHRYYDHVEVCEGWQDFVAFRDWALANGYEDHLVLDRVDPGEGYCPENCEWVSRSENSRRAAHTREATKGSLGCGTLTAG